MRKFKTVALLSLATIFILTSCTTIRSEYFVDDKPYLVQEKGEFAQPIDPITDRTHSFDGWQVDGQLYNDWTTQPKGVVRFDAVISKIPSYQFYLKDNLWKDILSTEYHDPGTPDTPETLSGKEIFVGWAPRGTTTIIEDISVAPVGIYEFDAIFDYLIWYYVEGEAWAFQKSADFGCPGDPTGKDIPRGYEFKGWVPITDYKPYKEWDVLPKDVRRFDALLSRETINSVLGKKDEIIVLNPLKDFDVLGPVSVEETYEIVNGKVRIGGIGYKEMLDRALELYPEADQVIDIITDYRTIEYDTDSTHLVFQTAVYTGLAIDINRTIVPEK